MDPGGVGAVAGLTVGCLAWGARRLPALGWVAVAPLGVALAAGRPAEAALGGALAGALAAGAGVARREFLALVPLTIVPPATAGALASAAGTFATARFGLSCIPLVLPIVTVATFLPLRLMGAPRWVSNPLACTQERWLTVVHTARLGGDFVTTAVLALGASVVALGAAAAVTSAASAEVGPAAAVALALVVAALAFGAHSRRRAILRQRGATVRLAAVVSDGPPPPTGEVDGLWPVRSDDYRDVEATVSRYDPLVRRAAASGAEVIVLPEVAVNIGAHTRDRWAAAVTSWAREHGVAVVAPCFDRDEQVNSLVVVDAEGTASTYDKQHPARGMEPPRRRRCLPGPRVVATRGRRIRLSTVICVDLDYGDLVAPVRAAGGVLAAPSNDWFQGFDVLHHRTAVWSAVLTGVPVVRATGHGISAVFDGAGRVLAERSSADGPVVLVVEAPLSSPFGGESPGER